MTISENEMAMFSCWKQQCERILPAIASVSCSVPATSCGSSAGRYSFFFCCKYLSYGNNLYSVLWWRVENLIMRVNKEDRDG